MSTIHNNNSSAENVDATRPLVDILWNARLSSYSNAIEYPVVNLGTAKSGDRNSPRFEQRPDGGGILFDGNQFNQVFSKQPSTTALKNFKDCRDNVLNALNAMNTKDIGPVLYFIAETADAKFDNIKADHDAITASISRIHEILYILRESLDKAKEKNNTRFESINDDLICINAKCANNASNPNLEALRHYTKTTIDELKDAFVAHRETVARTFNTIRDDIDNMVMRVSRDEATAVFENNIDTILDIERRETNAEIAELRAELAQHARIFRVMAVYVISIIVAGVAYLAYMSMSCPTIPMMTM